MSDISIITSTPQGDAMDLIAHLLCESPIEIAFLRALVLEATDRRITTAIVLNKAAENAYLVTRDFAEGCLLEIHCQPPTMRMRFDFALAISTDADFSGVLVVECDGHEFHERTKDQAIRDRARDRTVQKRGGAMFRFTGREIYRDALGCATQSLEFLLGKVSPPANTGA
jgi:very-short-patch-repair endonuclease